MLKMEQEIQLKPNPITEAIEAAGGPMAVAEACGLTSYQAVKKWEAAGKLPRTEWTKETNYAEKIYKAYGVVVPPFILLESV